MIHKPLGIGQIISLMTKHNADKLTWPHDLIACHSARHAVALLGKDLVEARIRIRALEDAIKKHKQRHASENYAACLDDNADLWEAVNDDA